MFADDSLGQPIGAHAPASTATPHYYLFPSSQTVDECSVYCLWPEEKYLIEKYFHPGRRVADLACGMGRTTLRLHELGFTVAASDISAALIEAARSRFPYLDFKVGSFTSVDAPDTSFDNVLISANAIDFAYPLTQRIVALREAARILKPGGTFLYSAHNLKAFLPYSPRYWRRPLWKLRHTLRAFRAVAPTLPDPYEDNNWGLYATPEEIIRHTEQAGFHFLEMRGMQMSGSRWLNGLTSIYIHYAFRRL
ncbi:MAG TPA: class I SAM-dependent methyltransferase [Terracidiphilus sp.]|jgi:ubiquinone/menaquinone biosynthesis C-methylase UbiE|nr:class I SAM-dependent methyltransferase [Terracidiphilus sp.]